MFWKSEDSCVTENEEASGPRRLGEEAGTRYAHVLLTVCGKGLYIKKKI